MMIGSKVQIRRHHPGGADVLLRTAVVSKTGKLIVVLDDGSRWSLRTMQPVGTRSTRGCGTFFEPRLVVVEVAS